MNETQMGILYLIPLPIAIDTQTKVLTPQILEVIPELDTFFVEDIRTARRFISSLKLGIVIDDLEFYVLDKKTEEQSYRDYIKILTSGKNAGLMSEAGSPGVADPGSVLVRLAHQTQVQVIPLVGPSSILLALMASGLNGQNFSFIGYLPIQRQERMKRIQAIEKLSAQKKQTQIFIETPYRNGSLFEDLLKTCQPHTKLCVACHLTSPEEFIKTQIVKDWKLLKDIDLHKKPTIFLMQA